jgi:curved DNA-binding protein CbpA
LRSREPIFDTARRYNSRLGDHIAGTELAILLTMYTKNPQFPRSKSELKNIFRFFSILLHPNKRGNTEHFKIFKNAYDILKEHDIFTKNNQHIKNIYTPIKKNTSVAPAENAAAAPSSSKLCEMPNCGQKATRDCAECGLLCEKHCTEQHSVPTFARHRIVRISSGGKYTTQRSKRTHRRHTRRKRYTILF